MDKLVHNSFDTIEEYRFSFGQYRGKTLEEIKDNEDSIEYLRRYRKKLIKEIKNPKAQKFIAYNERGLREVDAYLLKIGVKKENITSETIINQSSSYENNEEKLRSLTFKELIEEFENRILNKYDEKFQSKKFIKKEYKDYLCLRVSNLTYIELLEKQDSNSLIDVIKHI